MALIAVFGPHAIGKTTALEKFVREECQDLPHVTVALMDNNLELWWDDKGQLQEFRYQGRAHWKGSREDKLKEIWPCIACETELVIAETARISAVHETIADGFDKYGGGAKVVVVTCEPETLREFLVARCEANGKTFNADYWDDKRCIYESRGRYLNAAKKHFAMRGVPWQHFIIDRDRDKWAEVIHHIRSLAEAPLGSW